MSAPLRRTPLYEAHVAAGARLAPFAGFEMPLWYSNAAAEHMAVRRDAGIFDVSHMGEFRVRGSEAAEALDAVLTNAVANLAPGRARYTVMCNPSGGIVDDLIFYRLADDDFLMCVNAARRAADYRWLHDHLPPGVSLEDESERWALLAVQGPRAKALVAEVLDVPGLIAQRPFRVQPVRVDGAAAWAATTGYTGEPGFELFVPADAVRALWGALCAAGATPCGLAARDSLRLEMGYCLYGQDIDETTTPLEAGLDWVVRFDKGDFIGKDALMRQRRRGVERRLVGFVVEGRGIVRSGYAIFDADARVGRATSGGFSPILRKGIGMGYVGAAHAEPGRHLEADVRGRRVGLVITQPPFVSRVST